MYVVDESCVMDVDIYSNVWYTEAGLETACTKMLSVCWVACCTMLWCMPNQFQHWPHI